MSPKVSTEELSRNHVGIMHLAEPITYLGYKYIKAHESDPVGSAEVAPITEPLNKNPM